MSVAAYTPQKIITVSDVLDLFGFTEAQQQTLSAEERNRYQTWVREANTNVETDLFLDSDVTPVTEGTPVHTYAKSAAYNWVVYKKRDFAGSKNANAAKDDYKTDINRAKRFLQMTPTKKGEPIQLPVTTDSLEDFIVPYSQTLGYPQDLLF